MGVRGRLLLAFAVVSSFAVIAAAAALYAFSKSGDVLQQITEQRLPPALVSLDLSRHAERAVHAAPTLLAAATHDERRRISEDLTQSVEYLGEMLDQIADGPENVASIANVEVGPLIFGLESNFQNMDFLVERRIDLTAAKNEILDLISLNGREITRPMSGAFEELSAQVRRQAAQDPGLHHPGARESRYRT